MDTMQFLPVQEKEIQMASKKKSITKHSDGGVDILTKKSTNTHKRHVMTKLVNNMVVSGVCDNTNEAYDKIIMDIIDFPEDTVANAIVGVQKDVNKHKTRETEKCVMAKKLVNGMVARGYCEDNTEARTKQINEVMTWPKEAFMAMVKEFKKTPPKKEDAPKTPIQNNFEEAFSEIELKDEPIQFSEFTADVRELVEKMIEKGFCKNDDASRFTQLEECSKWDEAMFYEMWKMIELAFIPSDDSRLPSEKMDGLKSEYARMKRFKNAQKPDEIVKKTIEMLKTNNGFGQDKFPHQVNVKLTNEDMKRADAINEEYFGGDASRSMLIRAFARKGMEWYRKDSEGKE